jgi:hypothetical protein
MSGTTLSRLTETPVDLEAMLEGWIETDPSLLLPGLAIVARQLTLAGSGRLDLLGVDLNGSWTVIEIKRGVVDRDTLAQGLDYAAAIAAMPADDLRRCCDEYLAQRNTNLEAILRERQILQVSDASDRDVAVTIVGTGRAPTLERIVSFLTGRYDVPITVVSFDVFATPEGDGRILAREITEREDIGVGPSRAGVTSDDVLRLADNSGTGRLMRSLFDAAVGLQLYPRAWKTSIMFTPATRRNRTLFTAWASPADGKLNLYVANAAFAEFFPVTIEQAAEKLGPEGWRTFDRPALDSFMAGLQDLLRPSTDALAGA